MCVVLELAVRVYRSQCELYCVRSDASDEERDRDRERERERWLMGAVAGLHTVWPPSTAKVTPAHRK